MCAGTAASMSASVVGCPRNASISAVSEALSPWWRRAKVSDGARRSRSEDIGRFFTLEEVASRAIANADLQTDKLQEKPRNGGILCQNERISRPSHGRQGCHEIARCCNRTE